jgi:Tfp pilus assembly protein PilO
MSSFPIKDIRVPAWLKDGKPLQGLIAITAGVLCAVLLLYAFLVRPAGARLSAREAQYSDLRKRRGEALLFRKQKQELAGLKAGIPSQKDMPLLVKDLVQNARRLNLSVSTINYDMPRRGAEDLALLSFSFPAEGRYADVKRFVYDIETSDRLVGVQELKLSEGDKGRVQAQMKLVTYVKGR